MEENKTIVGRTAKVTVNTVGFDMEQRVGVVVGVGEYPIASDPYPKMAEDEQPYLAIRIKDNAGREVQIPYNTNMLLPEAEKAKEGGAWENLLEAIHRAQKEGDEINRRSDDPAVLCMVSYKKDEDNRTAEGMVLGGSKDLFVMLCSSMKQDPSIHRTINQAVNAVNLDKIISEFKK